MGQVSQLGYVEESRRKRPAIGSYDVIVAGAELAGVSAATAAARAGAKVVVFELRVSGGFM